jgi:hypothetical protein
MAVKNPTALLVAVAATLLVACEGQSFTADVSTTSTVTVGNATVLILAAPLVVEVEANPLRRDVFLELTGVLTASTASRAASLAEGLELVVTRPNERTMRVDVGGLEDAKLTGVLRAVVPEVLDLAVESAGARVTGMKRLVELQSSGGVEVLESAGSLTAIAGGSAVIDTLALQGSQVVVKAAGNVSLRLPAVPSVTLLAVSAASGQVVPQHPQLPALGASKTRYQVVANGGLAVVQVESTAGSVGISARNAP